MVDEISKKNEEVCIDTDVLINITKNRPSCIDKLKKKLYDKNLVTTAINVYEFASGSRELIKLGRDSVAKRLIDGILLLKIYSFDEECALIASEIAALLKSKGQMIDHRDIFIGSICLKHDIAILTGNVDHFKRIEGLRVLSYRDLLNE